MLPDYKMTSGFPQTENQGKMNIEFQVWKNLGICKKVRQIMEKSGNFITCEINQGKIREFYFGLWLIDECENLWQFLVTNITF